MIERRCNAVPALVATMATMALLAPKLFHPIEAFSLFQSNGFLYGSPRPLFALRFHPRSFLQLANSGNWHNSDEVDDDDDDDAATDADTLGNWRTFRRNLVASAASTATTSTTTSMTAFSQFEEFHEHEVSLSAFSPRSVSKENEDLLRSQNADLAYEYASGVWAHTTATPEVGGLVVRLPLEVEIFRNKLHSLIGRKLQRLLAIESLAKTESFSRLNQTEFDKFWYFKAQKVVQEEMKLVASQVKNGQIDASHLSDTSADMLQLYLDQQETWQEVCLVLQKDDVTGTATTVVLNRPMALKLTENLALLALFGAFSTSSERSQSSRTQILLKFMLAFGQECALYIGGPDAQDMPALMIHGHTDIPGAVELAPGTNLYQGGLDAAIDGVLWGKYQPMDFRFFVGRREFKDHLLDVAIVLGKYQPVACARSLALKQCISLPKPLWHEVLEFCGGEMLEISALELLKRKDLKFEIINEDYNDDDGGGDNSVVDEYDVPDELGELDNFDDYDEYFT